MNRGSFWVTNKGESLKVAPKIRVSFNDTPSR